MTIIRLSREELSDACYAYFGLEAESQPLNVEAFCDVVIMRGKRDRWIETSERAPLDDQTVFCYCPGDNTALPILAYYDEETKSFCTLFTWQDIRIYPTHWMEMPEYPENDQ